MQLHLRECNLRPAPSYPSGHRPLVLHAVTYAADVECLDPKYSANACCIARTDEGDQTYCSKDGISVPVHTSHQRPDMGLILRVIGQPAGDDTGYQLGGHKVLTLSTRTLRDLAESQKSVTFKVDITQANFMDGYFSWATPRVPVGTLECTMHVTGSHHDVHSLPSEHLCNQIKCDRKLDAEHLARVQSQMEQVFMRNFRWGENSKLVVPGTKLNTIPNECKTGHTITPTWYTNTVLEAPGGVPLHCYENWQAQEGARAFGPNAMQVLTAMGIEAHSIDGQINNTSPSALARGPLASLTRIGSNGCKYATDLSVDRRPSERFTHLPAIISSLHAAGLDRGKAYTVGDCEDSAHMAVNIGRSLASNSKTSDDTLPGKIAQLAQRYEFLTVTSSTKDMNATVGIHRNTQQGGRSYGSFQEMADAENWGASCMTHTTAIAIDVLKLDQLFDQSMQLHHPRYSGSTDGITEGITDCLTCPFGGPATYRVLSHMVAFRSGFHCRGPWTLDQFKDACRVLDASVYQAYKPVAAEFFEELDTDCDQKLTLKEAMHFLGSCPAEVMAKEKARKEGGNHLPSLLLEGTGLVTQCHSDEMPGHERSEVGRKHRGIAQAIATRCNSETVFPMNVRQGDYEFYRCANAIACRGQTYYLQDSRSGRIGIEFMELLNDDISHIRLVQAYPDMTVAEKRAMRRTLLVNAPWTSLSELDAEPDPVVSCHRSGSAMAGACCSAVSVPDHSESSSYAALSKSKATHTRSCEWGMIRGEPGIANGEKIELTSGDTATVHSVPVANGFDLNFYRF